MSVFVTGVTVTINDSTLDLSLQNKKAIAFFKFEGIPLVEEMTMKLLNNEGTQPPAIEEGAFGNGCRFRPQSRFSFPLELKSNTMLSCGFWLKPVNIRPVVSAATGETAYYRTSLFDKTDVSYSSASGLVTLAAGSFLFYEECRDANTNILRAVLVSESGEQCVVSSPAYNCDVMHFFWFVYNGNTQTVSVFIDGIEQVVTVEEGSIPSAINLSKGAMFNLNKSAIGYNPLLRTNTGLMDELVFFSDLITNPETISRIINYGSEYVIDETLFNRFEVGDAFVFDDPSALQVNAVFSNGKNIYVGRSDGKIFKGDRLMWEVRKDFSNSDERDSLQIGLLADDAEVRFEEGAMVVSKARVLIK